MGEISGIAWTDATFNPWWGCVRVSPGCERCYAEQLATVRRKLPVWGVDAERKPMSEAYWREPLKWNKKAQAAGARTRVFCASMADVFETPPARNVQACNVVATARDRLWRLIADTPHLDWLLLTKRPENIKALVPWGDTPLPNVWLGVTAEDQRRADERIPALLAQSAMVKFVSYEPALERVNFTPYLTARSDRYKLAPFTYTHGLDWLIIGGESGSKARPFAIEWAESALDQCKGTTCRPFVKQLGACVVSEKRTARDSDLYETRDLPSAYHKAPDGNVWAWRAGLKDPKGGDPSEWPTHLQVRQVP